MFLRIFSSCSYIKHIRSIVFRDPPSPPLFDARFIKRLLVAKKIRAGNVFSNSSPAYERINNSEGKRYDTDPYAIVIYQPHVHPRDISEIPAEGR